jgi:tetratricopeptide (TPR) repeat protein
MGLACSAINLDDITTANAAVDTIIADYSDHKDYADALSWTAHEYRKAGFQDRAIELYETVLALDANKGAHLRSAGGIAMLQTRLGNDQQVMEKVNYLLSNFDDSPQGVASYISYIVEEYYNKAVFMGDEKQAKKLLQKAINIAELRQDKYPDIKLKNPDDDANYNRCLGDCYRRTQQYQKAVDCYKQSLNTYPENKLAWNVQFQIGRCYDKMSEDNSFDKELAKGKAKLAYQTLLEKYPDCKAAKAVRSHLNKN